MSCARTQIGAEVAMRPCLCLIIDLVLGQVALSEGLDALQELGVL